MNRATKRVTERKQKRPKYSLIDVQKASNIAIEIGRINKGHLFSKAMKDKCVFCGKTTKARTKCQYWFFTFLDRMQIALINPSFFTDANIETLYLTHDSEYQDVVIPLNMKKK